MKIFNTLTRKIEDVKPMSPPKLGVYTCGPTVYDHAHVGHWFNYIRMDLLIRALKDSNFDVTWIMNITDVGHLTSDADEGEDKLQKGAEREGKTAWEVADFYAKEFIGEMEQLNILKPTQMVKATDHIQEQIDLIKRLDEKGFSYVIDDGVYYDTSKFLSYRDFARLDLDELQAGARVSYNKQKRNPSDFALWKFSPKDKKRDMEWDSPWGRGFPGWHIECSAMSMKYLGDTLDIHTGGIDHIPVHHTNEIAQSEAATGKRFSNYWLHSNHVTVNGQKISKSLGNGITLTQVIEKGFTPEDLRLHVLESHYQSQSKFSWDSLNAAKNRLRDLKAMAVLRYQGHETSHDYGTFALSDVAKEIASLLSNNLDTPNVMAYLSDVCTQLTTVGIENDMIDHFEAMLKDVDQLLGLKLSQVPDIDESAKALLKQRETARSSQDWGTSDNLRDQLLAKNIAVLDKPTGPQWQWAS